MDNEFPPNEAVLDDALEEETAPKVILAGPLGAPRVFPISPSIVERSRRWPPYARLALCIRASAPILGAKEIRRSRPESAQRAAQSTTKLEPPVAWTTATRAASAFESDPAAEADAAEAALEMNRVGGECVALLR
jgi:hypothetical protein